MKEISYQTNINTAHWWETEYDSEGNKVKRIYYYADGVTIKGGVEYDREGNEINWW